MAAMMQSRKPSRRAKTKPQKKSTTSTPVLATHNLKHEISISQARVPIQDEKEKEKDLDKEIQKQKERESIIKLTINDIDRAKQLQLQQQAFDIELPSNPDEITPKQLLNIISNLGFDNSKLLQAFKDMPRMIARLLNDHVNKLKHGNINNTTYNYTSQSYFHDIKSITPMKYCINSPKVYLKLCFDLDYNTIINGKKREFKKSLINEIAYNILQCDTKYIKIGQLEQGSVWATASITILGIVLGLAGLGLCIFGAPITVPAIGTTCTVMMATGGGMAYGATGIEYLKRYRNKRQQRRQQHGGQQRGGQQHAHGGDRVRNTVDYDNYNACDHINSNNNTNNNSNHIDNNSGNNNDGDCKDSVRTVARSLSLRRDRNRQLSDVSDVSDSSAMSVPPASQEADFNPDEYVQVWVSTKKLKRKDNNNNDGNNGNDDEKMIALEGKINGYWRGQWIIGYNITESMAKGYNLSNDFLTDPNKPYDKEFFFPKSDFKHITRLEPGAPIPFTQSEMNGTITLTFNKRKQSIEWNPTNTTRAY